MSDPGLRRGMSYRKPVPVYEPTPPPSPLPVPSPPSPLGDDLQLWQFTDQLLSLPPKWSRSREGVQSHAESSGQDTAVNANVLLVPSMLSQEHSAEAPTYTSIESGPPSRRANSVFRESQLELELEDRPSNEEGPDSERKRRRSRVHKEFRPPTPPLPAQHRRRRLTVTGVPGEHRDGLVLRNRNNSECFLYPPPKDVRQHEASIRPMSSFATERTFVDPVNPSAGWSGGLTTFVSESDPRLSNDLCHSIPPNDPPHRRKDFSHLNFDKAEYQATQAAPMTAPSTIYEKLKAFGIEFRKILVLYCC